MSKRCCAKDCYNSALTNKNVEYFGFPKSEYYAHQWATAAGREDLLSKPIQNLIKYCLCSEHFTDNCFTDDTRTHLRKQSRPKVIVPLPTIFKNNIVEFAPDTVKPFIEEKQLQVVQTEALASQTSVEKDEYDTNSDIIEYLGHNESSDNAFHVYLVPNTTDDDFTIKKLITDDPTQTESINLINNQEISVCRLCATIYADDTELLFPIFENQDLQEMIERLMPNTIFKNDGKPQQICNACYEQVKCCSDTIDSFYVAQSQINKMF